MAALVSDQRVFACVRGRVFACASTMCNSTRVSPARLFQTLRVAMVTFATTAEHSPAALISAVNCCSSTSSLPDSDIRESTSFLVCLFCEKKKKKDSLRRHPSSVAQKHFHEITKSAKGFSSWAACFSGFSQQARVLFSASVVQLLSLCSN